MTFKKNSIITFLLLLIAQSSFVLAQQSNERLRGVDFKDLHLSPIDSAVLRINSTWYSARDQYGEVHSSNETFYIKWTAEKEKYYPIMKEAWKYCIEHQPYQVNLYKDGVLLNLWMFQATKNMTYFDEMMKVYDMRIQNIDSINAHARRESDKSSEGGIMMQKARAYAKYIIKEDSVYTDSRAKELFVSAAETIRKDFNANKDLGGDIDHGGLQYYLGFALNDYANIVNNIQGVKSIAKKGIRNKEDGKLVTDTAKIRELAPNMPDIDNKLIEIEKHNQMVDSLNNISKDNDELKRRAKEPLLDRYNFIKDFCDRQINSLILDYVDTLSTDGTDSLDVMMREVVSPYKQLLAICDENMRLAHIDVNIQLLQDVEEKYSAELQSHKDSLQWLRKIKEICELTTDFNSDNLFYGFYEEVCDYYEQLEAKIAASKANTNTNQGKKRIDNVYYLSARKYINQVSGKRLDATVCRYYALIIYYLNEASRTDPLNSHVYQETKRYYTKQSAFRQELFMAGIREGQTLTVDGVTFKVVLR